MRKFLLSVACLGGVFIAGCNSGSSKPSGSGNFTGPSTATQTQGAAPQPNVAGGAQGQNPGILLPPGAPPEAAKTMQNMMGGATGVPGGGAAPGGAGGGAAPGGAPSKPPGGNP